MDLPTVLPLYSDDRTLFRLRRWNHLKGWFMKTFVFALFISAFLFRASSNTVSVFPSCFRILPLNTALQRFSHTNGAMLSPREQDKRWEDYKQHYISYQSRLTNTSYEYYVIYHTTYSGLANKINGLVSSLLLAMLTDRGFKLADWPSFDSYFKLPLVNHHLTGNLSKGSTIRVWHRCVDNKRLMKNSINSEYGDRNIDVITNCPLYLSIVQNDMYYEDFVNRGLIRTAHRGDYKTIASEIYYRLLNFFTLEDSLQEKLDSIMRQWKDHYVVGLQIRVGLGNSAFLDNCKFLFERDIDTFIYYAQYYSNRTSLKPLWFVSTDSPKVEEELTKKYPQYVFSIKDLPLKHTKSLVYQYSEPASQRAILDNYLLSHSDLLLTTAWSSFGEIALGRMDSGNTIMITRSDPIFNPPPLVKFNRTEI